MTLTEEEESLAGIKREEEMSSIRGWMLSNSSISHCKYAPLNFAHRNISVLLHIQQRQYTVKQMRI